MAPRMAVPRRAGHGADLMWWVVGALVVFELVCIAVGGDVMEWVGVAGSVLLLAESLCFLAWWWSAGRGTGL